MKKYFIVPGLIALLTLSHIPLYAASSNTDRKEKQRESKEILRNIQEKDTYQISPLSIQDQGKGKFSHKQKSYDMDIGFDTDTKKVTLKKGELVMSMGLPQSSKSTTIKMLDGQVISSDEKSDIVTQSIDGGVRQMISIYSSDAEKVYDFPLTLPDGYSLTQDGSGNILIQNTSGNILSYIGKPWAKDANGKEIPTHYEIQGNTLRQFIDFDEKTAFPVVADPAWCGASIASTNWVYRQNDPNQWSLSVYPTECGKLWLWGAGGLNGQYSFQEVLALTPATKQWDKKYGTWQYWSMYDQYICHANIVVLFKKYPWNLEPSRPNVGYTATVNANCNP